MIQEVLCTLLKNSMFHDRTKYIELDCHIVRDRFLIGLLKPLPLCVSCQVQLADIFTKPLAVARFKLLLSQLGVYNLYRV